MTGRPTSLWRRAFLRRYLGVVILVLLTSFSAPVYCHSEITNIWQGPEHHLEVQDWSGGNHIAHRHLSENSQAGAAFQGECQLEGPSGNSLSSTSLLSEATMDQLWAPFLLVPYAEKSMGDGPLAFQVHTRPLEPPPRSSSWAI